MGLPKQAPVTHWSVLPVISQVVGSAAHFDGIRVPSAKRIKLLLRARPNTQSPLRAWWAERNIGRRALRRSSATEAASVSRHDAASQSPTVPSLWASHNTHLSLTPFSIIPKAAHGKHHRWKVGRHVWRESSPLSATEPAPPAPKPSTPRLTQERRELM
ncbi:hypothetical protein F5883DRAFT_561128 [Diaporthe sp. PMI_573]|nr:hypothetical protein F5883DRAFT_561128 [Diaporthaceae sp. PMI_573]